MAVTVRSNRNGVIEFDDAAGIRGQIEHDMPEDLWYFHVCWGETYDWADGKLWPDGGWRAESKKEIPTAALDVVLRSVALAERIRRSETRVEGS